MSEVRCYDCGCVMPPDDPIRLVCPACGKVWIRLMLKPTEPEKTYIKGASMKMGGKSSKKKGSKEKLKRPTPKKLFERLFGNW